MSTFVSIITTQVDTIVDEPSDELDSTTERTPGSLKPCEGERYEPDFWRKSIRGLGKNQNKPERTDWYHNETMSGTYLPNEYDKTCGAAAKFGYIVCPPGQDCDAKQGAYPFIAALGRYIFNVLNEPLSYILGL